MFGWGNNRDGRIFKEDVGDLLENPRKYEHFVNKYMKLIDVSCGNSHIAAVACNKDVTNPDLGYVFTWGLDLFGRLGYLSDSVRGFKEGEEGIFYIKQRAIYIQTKPNSSKNT